MRILSLGVLLLVISTASFAQGRKPAVEDFVGIDIEQTDVVPQGTEALYNLEQDLSKIEKKNSKNEKKISAYTPTKNWNITIVFGVSTLLGLPLIVWFLVMAHLRKKASVESASNIELLEKYRKEREKLNSETKKKAS